MKRHIWKGILVTIDAVWRCKRFWKCWKLGCSPLPVVWQVLIRKFGICSKPGDSEPLDNFIPSHCVWHLAGKTQLHQTFDKVRQVITLGAIVLRVWSYGGKSSMLLDYFFISWRYIYNGWVVKWWGAHSTFLGLQVQIQARTDKLVRDKRAWLTQYWSLRF